MDDSSIRESILAQYGAALDMLGKAIDLCPEELWLNDEDRNRFWHLAYHAIYYTHLYVQSSESDFQPWAKHVPNSNRLGPRPGMNDETFQIPEPYAKPDVQEYLRLCRSDVEKQIPSLRLDDASSGFSWLPFGKLELQFYNIRHLQHHTGQLIDRLRNTLNVGVGWVVPR